MASFTSAATGALSDPSLNQLESTGGTPMKHVGAPSHALDGVGTGIVRRGADGFNPEPLGTLQTPIKLTATFRSVPTSEKVQAIGTSRNSQAQEEPGQDWFEKIHTFPFTGATAGSRTIAAGLVLTPADFTIAIYNADRFFSHDWDAFANNVDAGVSITDLPSLPFTMLPQTGTNVNLNVTPVGPSSITGTLDFQFDFPVDPSVAFIEVTGDRIVMFLFPPEKPLTERLEFLTEVMTHVDGTEQRVALRKNPRQSYEMLIVLEDGPERQRFDYVLFDRQALAFGLPMWHEPMALTSPASIDDTTINVDTTDFTDLRVGGQAVIIDPDGVTFDALAIASFTATSITFDSGITHDYVNGSEVYPLRTVLAPQTLAGSRRAQNLQEMRVTMRVTDNDADLADASAFNTFDGDSPDPARVFLDDDNLIEDTIPTSSERKIFTVDGQTGAFVQRSAELASKRAGQKGFFMGTRQRLFEVRQLLHFLKGRATTFYMPTFYKDITPAVQFANGAVIGTIVNVGYSRFIQTRRPNIFIQVVLNDGTIFTREITDSAPIDDDTEQITVDVGWPQDIEPEDVKRISFIEKVRLADDSLAIEHVRGGGQARLFFPTITVLD